LKRISKLMKGFKPFKTSFFLEYLHDLIYLGKTYVAILDILIVPAFDLIKFL